MYRIYKPLLSETVDIPVRVMYRGTDSDGNRKHEVLFENPAYFHMVVPVELNPSVWESVMNEWFFTIILPGEIAEKLDISQPVPQKSLQRYNAKGKYYAFFDWGGIRFRFPLVEDTREKIRN